MFPGTTPLTQAKQFLAQGRYDEAAHACQQVLQTKPRYAPAYQVLAICFSEQRRVDHALGAIDHALSLTPASPPMHVDRGKILQQLSRFEDAEDAFRESLRLRPGYPYAISALSGLLRMINRHDEAAEVMTDAIDDNPDHLGMIIEFADAAQTTEDRERALGLVTTLLETGVDPAFEVLVLFSYANTLNRLERYEEAWAAFERANDAAYPGWDAETHRAETDRLIDAWTPDRIADLPRADESSDLPVLIVGLPRSGTSLTEQIIATHRDGAGCGELKEFARIAFAIRGLGPTMMPMMTDPSLLTTDALNTHRGEYLSVMRSYGADALRATDKMPENGFHLGWASRMLPGMKVIRCRRSPIEVAVSCFTTRFVGHLEWTYNYDAMASYFRDNERVLDHFCEILDVPVLDWRYEEVVADPETHMRRLVDFLDLEWDDACLKFHENRRVVVTASNQQVNKPIYKSSVEKHKRFGPGVQRLIDALEQQGVA